MHNEELYENIDNTLSITEKYLGLSLSKFLVFLFLVLVSGVYIGVLLFGENSLEVYLGLEDYDRYLKQEISTLKTQNASLQKEYFELKEISAQ